LTKDGMPRFPVYVGLRPDGNPNTAPPTRKPVAAIANPAPAPPPPAPPPPAPAGNAKRYFEFVDGTSTKFWEICPDGADVVTRWGRIGTRGRERRKSLGDKAKAKKEYDKLLAEKTGKGYVEKPRPA